MEAAAGQRPATDIPGKTLACAMCVTCGFLMHEAPGVPSKRAVTIHLPMPSECIRRPYPLPQGSDLPQIGKMPTGSGHFFPGEGRRDPLEGDPPSGYAVRTHHLVNRPSQDPHVATENPAPMADIAATLRVGLESSRLEGTRWRPLYNRTSSQVMEVHGAFRDRGGTAVVVEHPGKARGSTGNNPGGAPRLLGRESAARPHLIRSAFMRTYSSPARSRRSETSTRRQSHCG